jgi:hypothetical protein
MYSRTTTNKYLHKTLAFKFFCAMRSWNTAKVCIKQNQSINQSINQSKSSVGRSVWRHQRGNQNP